MWKIGTDNKCPVCGNEIETFVDTIRDENLAERCTRCKWQINFNPKIKKVLYGTKPK